MRVLIAHPRIGVGGAEKHVVYTAYNLALLGHEVAVMTLSVEDLDKMPPVARKVRFVEPATPMPRLTSATPLKLVRRMAEELLSMARLTLQLAERFDVVVPFNFPAYWCSPVLKRVKPVVWVCCEVFGAYRQAREWYYANAFFKAAIDAASRLDKLVVKQGVTSIVTVSHLNRRLIRARYGRSSEVVYPGVDCSLYLKAGLDARRRFGLEDRFILLHVGELVEVKGHLSSIRALKLLKGDVKNATLVIVGGGPLKGRLVSEAFKLGVKDSVLFLQGLSEEELVALYKASDVCLYPVKEQSFGLVPFEALAAKTPVVVSKYCGAAEVVLKEGIGIVVAPEPTLLAKAVYRLQRNPKLASELALKGFNYTLKNLTWEHYALRVEGILNKALSLK